MVTAFPRKTKTSLCALVACCLQPSHTPEPSDEARCMVQEQSKHRYYQDPIDALLRPATIPYYQNPPRWVKDDHIKACVKCNVEFDLIKRKHHCRCCGLIFCGHCSANFDRVVKFSFMDPVRLCNNCASMTKNENVFYEKFLPLLESGDMFSKYGMLRKRQVYLKYVRAKNIFQYQKFDPENGTCEGDIKALSLDGITDVREVDVAHDNADVGIIVAVGPQEHRFDATTGIKRQLWIEALIGARQLRELVLAKEREERLKQVEKENNEICKLSENLQLMEERRLTFQEDRMRHRAAKREQLRAKYHLASAVA
ncbi:unnamed protein product [Peronospora belbahrii]|uniref:FYVE-type domain-containing protein n=1 Tax=Peronospora belbahrii TaxID=622444 RepID=A0AAU9LGG2_9STRA|nr:unnamed protein product [Peronospora belbahrii]CAH0522386.1 unnamed protein product [Peronospora belbahrii]